MFTFILGGSASGKSAFAERMAAALPGPRYYIATMQPFDRECELRIARHRAQRAGLGFSTVECPMGLEKLSLPRRGTVLLECVGNLTANEMFSPQGAGDGAAEAVLRGVFHLLPQCAHLIAVGNEVFCGGADYDPSTLHYLQQMALINRGLAARADRAVEVSAGIPIFHKGAGR